jgi:hypothetical protein
MISKLSANVQRITQIGLPKYYVCYWPITNFTEEYYETKKDTDFKAVNANFEAAVKSAISLGLSDLKGVYEPPPTPTISATIGSTPQPTTTTTPTPTPTKGTIPPPTPTPTPCEKPVITSFTPTFGGVGTILTITGKYLQSTVSVKINDIQIDKGIIKSKDGTQVTVTVPKSRLNGIQDNPISLLYRVGNEDDAVITSTNKFTYNPAQTIAISSAAPLDTANVSQQTQTEIVKVQSSTFQDGLTGPKVLTEKINTVGAGTMQNISVKVNTDVGTWAITESVNIQLQLFGYDVGPNNSINKVLIQEQGFTETGFVSTNKQSFYISFTDIDDLVKNSGEFTDEEIKKTKEILGRVFLTTIPADKNKQQINSTYNFKILIV